MAVLLLERWQYCSWKGGSIALEKVAVLLLKYAAWVPIYNKVKYINNIININTILKTIMKKLSVFSLALCAVLALASCGSSKESAYKKAYEKAQQQETQQEVAPEVVTPLETTTPTESTATEVDNATVRQENLDLISGSGLQNYSVVVGSFSLKSNAEGLASTLKSAGYDSQIAYNSERNMYRVVAATFVDKSSAVKSRNKFRASKYPDAWLLLKK